MNNDLLCAAIDYNRVEASAKNQPLVHAHPYIFSLKLSTAKFADFLTQYISRHPLDILEGVKSDWVKQLLFKKIYDNSPHKDIGRIDLASKLSVNLLLMLLSVYSQ